MRQKRPTYMYVRGLHITHLQIILISRLSSQKRPTYMYVSGLHITHWIIWRHICIWVPYICRPLTGEIRHNNNWISRLSSFPGHSLEWQGLRLLTWKSVWNVGDSQENVFDLYGDFCENLLEIVAVVILWSLISSVCDVRPTDFIYVCIYICVYIYIYIYYVQARDPFGLTYTFAGLFWHIGLFYHIWRRKSNCLWGAHESAELKSISMFWMSFVQVSFTYI